MYAFVSLLVIISLSMLVVRIGTVALTMTGLSKEVASFQSLSAFSGAGFTTDEAEEVTAYPSRRLTVKMLMRLGNVGLVTTVASLVVSFADPVTRFERLIILTAVCLGLLGLARSERFNDLVTPVIKRGLSRTARFEPRDYTGLLNLDRDYRVADLAVEEGDWLADERLGDLELRSKEGVTILGIEREDDTYIGAPAGEHTIHAGDRLVAYGRAERLKELADRDEDDDAAHEAAKREHDRLIDRERDIDPKRSAAERGFSRSGPTNRRPPAQRPSSRRPNCHGSIRPRTGMDSSEFYAGVEQRSTLADETDARDATQAVLSALGERIDESRSQRLDGELPDEIGDHLTDGASGRRVSYDEFLERVRDRTDRAEIGDPEQLSRAVLETLLEGVDDEGEELRERLEEFGYDELITTGNS